MRTVAEMKVAGKLTRKLRKTVRAPKLTRKLRKSVRAPTLTRKMRKRVRPPTLTRKMRKTVRLTKYLAFNYVWATLDRARLYLECQFCVFLLTIFILHNMTLCIEVDAYEAIIKQTVYVTKNYTRLQN
jgi:hypothetical protein